MTAFELRVRADKRNESERAEFGFGSTAVTPANVESAAALRAGDSAGS